MSIGVKITGFSEAVRKLQTVKVGIHKASAQALLKSTLEIHSTAVKSIQAISPGEKVGGRTVSKPGDPPNTDSGGLVSSINFEFKKSKTSATSRVGTNEKHGTHMEFGTRHIQARPWLLPAFKKHLKDIEINFKRVIKKVIKKVAA